VTSIADCKQKCLDRPGRVAYGFSPAFSYCETEQLPVATIILPNIFSFIFFYDLACPI
jgi:hypothetical protein